MTKPILPAANFHLWKYCNYKCKYCFATFDDEPTAYRGKSFLSEKEMLYVIEELAAHGISKITFAGGEPLLCKWLPHLISHAKHLGLTTMVVSNGYLLSERWLSQVAGDLDWFTLSIDSVTPAHQIEIGRTDGRRLLTAEEYLERTALIKGHGIRVKLNTVVCSINKDDNISDFVLNMKPERWKVFQALKVIGQNDAHIDRLSISKEAFDSYVSRHAGVVQHGIPLIAEDNDLMTGSYLMVDPLGRFYDNVNGTYQYSAPIPSIGLEAAIRSVRISEKKFVERNGIYNWK